MFILDFLLRILPERLPSWLGAGPITYWITSAYRASYVRLSVSVSGWHYRRLTLLDSSFRIREEIREATIEIVRKREEAQRRGIGPLDPAYPRITNVHKIRGSMPTADCTGERPPLS